MRIQYLFTFFISLLFCFQSSAITVPRSYGHQPAEDSTPIKLSVPAAMPLTAKKVGFFGKIKNKLLSLYLQRQMKTDEKASAKSTLGWLSLGMIALGIILLFVSAGGGALGSAILLLAGILTGIVALILPRSKADKEQKKKRNTGAIIGLALGFGFILALVIAFAGSSWH